MQYSVVHLQYDFSETWQQDLFEQAMCDIGFEVFDGSDAYIQTAVLTESQAHMQALVAETEGVELLSIAACEDKNWNEAWESEHEIEQLGLGVRIVPHCAFGTGHHETTSMMVDALLAARAEGYFAEARRVLDMGCGTGVLGIMAKKCGAEQVVAIDIDDKSVMNTQENAANNNVELDVRLGSTPPNEVFHLILANIHRNILLEQLPHYSNSLPLGGEVWMSGFYETDIAVLVDAAKAVGLELIATKGRNEWRMIQMKKTRE